jgi:predicted nucleic acid-binding Zn ribbon protein
VPTYEYHCEANGRVVEVSHKMAEKLTKWGELCERAGIAPGKAAINSPVSKLMSAGFVNTGNASPCESSLPPCQTGEGCGGGGMCGLN